MFATAFGKTLYRLRKEANLSQEKLAELSGFDPTYISLIERGLRNPTVKVLFNLSKPLGVSPHQFVKAVEELLK